MNYNPSGNFFTRIPTATRHLILINIIIWVAEACIPALRTSIVTLFGLHYFSAADFNPAQLVTSLFVHDPSSIMHVLFNMFTLWMFGRILEPVWGSARFIFFYFVCGIGASLVQELAWALTWEHNLYASLAKLNGLTIDTVKEMFQTATGENLAYVNSIKESALNGMITVGASGAVFGILLGFAFVFPNLPMYLFFIPVPIKAKYMVAGYAVIEFFLGVANMGGDTVAHFAHLGGLIFGLIILLYWKSKGKLGGTHFYH